MADRLIVMFGTMLVIKDGSASYCSSIARQGDLPHIKMCQQTDTSIKQVIIDSHDVTNSNECKCTFSVSSAETAMTVNGIRETMMMTGTCRSRIQIKNSDSFVVYEYHCPVNNTVSLRVDRGKKFTLSWMKMQEVQSSEEFCLKISVEEEPMHVVCSAAYVPTGDRWYIYAVPIVVIVILIIIIIIAVLYRRKKNIRRLKRYTKNDGKVENHEDADDLDTLATEGELDDSEEIVPDEVTVSFYDMHKIKENSSKQQTKPQENEVEEIVPDDVTVSFYDMHKIREQANSDENSSQQASKLLRENSSSNSHCANLPTEIKSSNGDVFYVIAPSGDEYAIVSKSPLPSPRVENDVAKETNIDSSQKTVRDEFKFDQERFDLLNEATTRQNSDHKALGKSAEISTNTYQNVTITNAETRENSERQTHLGITNKDTDDRSPRTIYQTDFPVETIPKHNSPEADVSERLLSDSRTNETENERLIAENESEKVESEAPRKKKAVFSIFGSDGNEKVDDDDSELDSSDEDVVRAKGENPNRVLGRRQQALNKRKNRLLYSNVIRC